MSNNYIEIKISCSLTLSLSLPLSRCAYFSDPSSCCSIHITACSHVQAQTQINRRAFYARTRTHTHTFFSFFLTQLFVNTLFLWRKHNDGRTPEKKKYIHFHTHKHTCTSLHMHAHMNIHVYNTSASLCTTNFKAWNDSVQHHTSTMSFVYFHTLSFTHASAIPSLSITLFHNRL